MKLVDFSVHKPIAVSMFIGIILLGGIVAFQGLGLDLFPEMESPVLTVSTQYPGASPQDVEDIVTVPLEGILSLTKNVKHIYSTSKEGVSSIVVEFEWGANLDASAEDIRSNMSIVKAFFPEEVKDSVIMKENISMMPVAMYSVTGIDDLIRLSDFVEDNIVPKIERLEGVGGAFAMGMMEREIDIYLNSGKMRAYNISIERIVNVLRGQNVNVTTGHLVKGNTEYLVRVMGEYRNIEQIKNTIIANYGGNPIYIKQIAKVVDTHIEERHHVRLDGSPAVMFAATKQSGGNTVSVINRVEKKIEELKKDLPEGIIIKNVFDQGSIIKRTLANTLYNGLAGALLAVVVLFLFLKNWRPTLVIALAIPTSIIATFMGIYLFDYTFNILTLAGLALVAGMLIDNAVVVIENIFRNIEEGKGRHEAAKKGTSEVGMAITASTTTTIIVFLPMIFASGLAGILSRPMALTITMGLLSSLLVAFTLIPMISARLFNRQTAYGYRKSAGKRGKGYLENFKKWYAKKLELALCNRKKVLAGAGAAFVLSIVLVSFLGFEFMPTSDSPITLMKISLPVGTPLEETNRITGKIERMFLNLEEKKIVAAVVGSSQDGGGGGMGISDVNEAMIIAQLVNKEKRKRSSGEITDEIRSKIPKLKSSKIEFIDMSGSSMGGGMGEGGSFPVNIKVFGDDLEVLKGLSAKIIKKIEGVEGLRDINSTYNEGKPEIRFVPNKEKASLFGLTTAQVGMAVSAAQSGKVATRYREHGKTTDVRVRFMKKDRNDLHDLENILIATPFNTQVPLKQLVNIKYSEGPIKIAREDKKRLVCVTANIKDRSISAIVDDIRKKLKDMTFPQGYFIEFGGSYEQTTDTLITLLQAFIAAVLLIYMVLAILYESLAQPFIILFTVPLSIIGVIVGLFFFGMTVSTPSFMGIIILAGVVVNNGIVMIDYVNRLRRQGMEKHKALIQGALTRVRPIFITSFTTIMGVLPMAFSRSQGSEMRAPIGVSLGSGLFFGMFLTLFIIPVIYSVVDHISFNVKNKSKKMFHGG